MEALAAKCVPVAISPREMLIYKSSYLQNPAWDRALISSRLLEGFVTKFGQNGACDLYTDIFKTIFGTSRNSQLSKTWWEQLCMVSETCSHSSSYPNPQSGD